MSQNTIRLQCNAVCAQIAISTQNIHNIWGVGMVGGDGIDFTVSATIFAGQSALFTQFLQYNQLPNVVSNHFRYYLSLSLMTKILLLNTRR